MQAILVYGSETWVTKEEDTLLLERTENWMMRWFGHVERKNADDWVSGCRGLVVDGARGAGRGMKTWKPCLAKDMKDLKLKAKDAQYRTKWGVAIQGRPSNPS